MKRKYMTLILICIIIASILLAGGCKQSGKKEKGNDVDQPATKEIQAIKDENTETETPADDAENETPTDSEPLPENSEAKTEGETKYQLVTEELEFIEYLPEDYPLIKEIMNVVEPFNYAYFNADYKNFEGNEWFDYFCKERLDIALESNEQELAKEAVNKHKLVMNCLDMTVDKIRIIEGENIAVVDITTNVKIESATDEYLKNREIEAGDVIPTSMQYVLIYEDSQWKINFTEAR